MYYVQELLVTKLTPSKTSPATAYVLSLHSPLNIVTSSIPKMSSEIKFIQNKMVVMHCIFPHPSPHSIFYMFNPK